MKPSYLFGIYTGLAVAFWTYVIGFTGWYKDPVMINLFWLVVIFQIVFLFYGLKIAGADGKPYTKLIKDGLVITIVAGIIIFASSLLFTTFVFPEYFNEMQEIHRHRLREAGKSEAEIVKLIEIASKSQTPFINAMSGFIGTFLTGLLGSAIIAAILRKK